MVAWLLTTKVLQLQLACINVLLMAATGIKGQDLPTVYEYFTEGGIQSGLTADTPGFFKLNGKDLRIISGAIHYFRVHPVYWRDRLRKLRATGANTVETYVPWNLHEPEKGVFDFGDGDRDFSAFLNVRRFVEIAKEEDLLVLFRPGPYICSEWDFGGLPSWLQRDPGMQVRTSYQPYMDRVKIYFDQLLPQVSDLQFTKGGAIVGIQIENEYGSFQPIHKPYLEHIKAIYEDHTFGESLLFTSDGISWNGDIGTLPGVLITSNFQTNPEGELDKLLQIQPNRPVMVMEYWAGWFDHWFEQHHTTSPDQFANVLETIFSSKYNGSVNFYMWHGGTNFGFMAGANTDSQAPFYGADVTSYDYDAPLSEAGDYTEKYNRTIQLIEQYQVPALRRPVLPPETVKLAYPVVQLQDYLNYQDILSRIPASARFTLEKPVSMEMLDMNNDSGQSHGYIVYRKVVSNLQPGTKLKAGPVKDFGMLLFDGQIMPNVKTTKNSGYWLNEEQEFDLSLDGTQRYLIDILVENMGRVNFGHAADFLQQKGIPSGNISINGVPATDFQVLALEFKSKWVQKLSNWRTVEGSGPIKGPAMFRSTFTLSGIADTFLDMRGWHKGIVFINGFNLGRYFKAGPQQTLFVPAPLLRPGTNTITIFEQLEPGTNIQFVSHPILDQTPPNPLKPSGPKQ